MRCNFLCDLACIDYNFAVESVEHDLFRDDIHQSVPSTFKSEAIPRLTSTNKKVKLFHIPFLFACKQLTKTYQALYLKQNVKEKKSLFHLKDFKISYYFDKMKGVHDLAKVSIRYVKFINTSDLSVD